MKSRAITTRGGAFAAGNPSRRRPSTTRGRKGRDFDISKYKDKKGRINWVMVERAIRFLLKGALGAPGMSDADISLSMVKKAYKTLSSNGSIDIKPGVSVGMQSNYEEGPVNGGQSEVPYVVSETQQRKASGATGYASMIHKTRYEYGKKSTSTVNQYAKLNGTFMDWDFDTQFEAAYNQNTTGRDTLSRATGFNQKEAVTYDFAHRTALDLVNYFAFNSWKPAEDRKERIYGYVRKMCSEYKIMNAGSYFPSKVSVKIYEPTSNLRTISSAITTAFPTEAQFTGDLVSDALPLRYVFGGYSATEAAAFAYSGRMDPTATLSMSSAFDRRFKLVKSFRKTLRPGDVWDFSATNHCGAGVRLDQIAQIEQESAAAALVGNLIVIEHHGVPCEATSIPNAGESYYGTSPSYLQISFRRGLEFVRGSQVGLSDQQNTGSTGGLIDPGYQIRAFAEKPASSTSNTDRRINFDAEQITDPAGGGSVYIPVMADTTVQYAADRGSV